MADLNAYTTSLLQHLPNGPAWPRDDGSRLAALMRGLATEFTRIDARAQQLVDESLPSYVTDTLARWEKDYGLPDKCTPSGQTTEERKDALVQKYLIYGSQSRAFQISLCEALGCQADITEYKVSKYGGSYGAAYRGQDWAFVVQFNIVLPETDNPDGLKQVLECTLRRVVHSHKYAIFNYLDPAAHQYNLVSDLSESEGGGLLFAGAGVTPKGYAFNGWSDSITVDITGLSSQGFSVIFTAESYTLPLYSADAVVFSMGSNDGENVALKQCQDSDFASVPCMVLQLSTGAGTTYDLPIARDGWRYESRLPQLTRQGRQGYMQGLHFINSDALIFSAHYSDVESVFFETDLTSMTTSESFSTSDFPHISAISADSLGNLWAADWITGSLIMIDYAESVASGSLVVLLTYDLSAIALSGIGFYYDSDTGIEYLLALEYIESGTPYLYTIDTAQITDGGVFELSDRHRRWLVNERSQALNVDGSDLRISMNRTTAIGSGSVGLLHRHTIDIGLADGASLLTPDHEMHTATAYPEDIDIHPDRGSVWIGSEGWQALADIPAQNAIHSYDATQTTVSHEVYVEFSDSEYVVSFNGGKAQSITGTPEYQNDNIIMGGTSSAEEGFENGFYRGYIRGLRVQDAAMTDDQKSQVRSVTSSLSSVSASLVNPGAENADTTGWVNETGSLSTRSSSPSPWSGEYYFSGGANASTVATQRIDLVAAGLSQSDIDDGRVRVHLLWRQASYTDQDPVALNIRQMNESFVLVSEAAGHKAWVPGGQSGLIGNWRPVLLHAAIDAGIRFIDIVYDASRTSGTNLDGYIDDVEVIFYIG